MEPRLCAVALLLLMVPGLLPGAQAAHDETVELLYPDPERARGDQMLEDLRTRLHRPIPWMVHLDQIHDFATVRGEHSVRLDIERIDGTTDAFTLPILDGRLRLDLDRVEPLAIARGMDDALTLLVPLETFYASANVTRVHGATSETTLKGLSVHLARTLDVPADDLSHWNINRHAACGVTWHLPARHEQLEDQMTGDPLTISTGNARLSQRQNASGEGPPPCHIASTTQAAQAGLQHAGMTVWYHTDRPWVTVQVEYWADWDKMSLPDAQTAGRALLADPAVPLQGYLIGSGHFHFFDGGTIHPTRFWQIAVQPDIRHTQPCELGGFVDVLQDAVTLEYLSTQSNHTHTPRCEPNPMPIGATTTLLSLGGGFALLGLLYMGNRPLGGWPAALTLTVVAALLLVSPAVPHAAATSENDVGPVDYHQLPEDPLTLLPALREAIPQADWRFVSDQDVPWIVFEPADDRLAIRIARTGPLPGWQVEVDAEHHPEPESAEPTSTTKTAAPAEDRPAPGYHMAGSIVPTGVLIGKGTMTIFLGNETTYPAKTSDVPDVLRTLGYPAEGRFTWTSQATNPAWRIYTNHTENVWFDCTCNVWRGHMEGMPERYNNVAMRTDETGRVVRIDVGTWVDPASLVPFTESRFHDPARTALAAYGVKDPEFVGFELDPYGPFGDVMLLQRFEGKDTYGIHRTWFVAQDAGTAEVLHVGAEPKLYPVADARSMGPGLFAGAWIVATIAWLVTRKWNGPARR